MRLFIKGEKIRYRLKYRRFEDDLNIKLPKYSVFSNGSIKQNDGWKECSVRAFKFPHKTTLEVSASQCDSEGNSNLGKVGEHLLYKKFELNKFNIFLINVYEFFFFQKIRLLSFLDRLKPIRKNLKYISFAALGAVIYYAINHYFDNFLQNLINKSNFVQSLIVFLSLSSIINIFHPFTIRKEVTIEEVNELITKKIEKSIEKEEREKRFRAKRDMY